MLISYCFPVGFNCEQTARESSIVNDQSISRETVVDRFSFCREMRMIALDNHFAEEGCIGGIGKIVETDACKIGRREYERGRVVEVSWVLRLTHIGHPYNYLLEICHDNKRHQATLLELLKKHVTKGPKIHTNCWKCWINLEDDGLIHQTANHTEKFVNHDTGALTQNFESSWRWMQRFLSRRGVHKSNLADHLCESLWWQRFKKIGADPLKKRFADIKVCYPGHWI